MSDTGILISLDNEDAFRSRVVLDYTSRDFSGIRTQLVGLAKGLMPEWETAGEAPDFGTLLLELFAYMGDVMHFYIDRTASEAFLGTAVRRQSILYIADMLGYRPIGQMAASVQLLFSLDSNATESVSLPQYLRVYNETDNSQSLVVFETDLALDLNPGDTDIPVTATEGIMVYDQVLGVSLGIPNSEFLLRDKGVVFNTVSVRSDEGGQTLPWTFVTDLSLARPTQTVFTTFMDDTDMTHVVFGDNAAGRIPPVNATMYASYRFGVGARANNVPAEKLNTIAAASAPNLDLWGVSVRNPNPPVGGTDPEGVDAMRFSIPRAASRIKSRAITLNDYADLAMQVPGVAKSVAHGTIYTAVHVTIAPTGGQGDAGYMTKLCANVEDYMKDKIIVGSTVYAEPEDVNALWLDVYIRLQLHVVEGYNRTNVRLQVESVIRQILAFDRVDFGWRVTIGRIYRAALAIQGVEWAEVMWLSTDEPPDGFAPVTGGDATNYLLSETWAYDTTLTMADPLAQRFRFNNATTPTAMALSITDNDKENKATSLAQVKLGDTILLRQVADPDSQMTLIVTATPTNNTTWYQFTTVKTASPKWTPFVTEVQTITPTGTISGGTWTLTLNLTGTAVTTAAIQWNAAAAAIKSAIDAILPGNTVTVAGSATIATVAHTLTFIGYGNAIQATVNTALLTGTTPTLTLTTTTAGNDNRVTISIIHPATDISTGEVLDIDTDPLLIPRIEPTEVIEEEVNYPTGWTEEERSHDGLWVWAIGGVPGT